MSKRKEALRLAFRFLGDADFLRTFARILREREERKRLVAMGHTFPDYEPEIKARLELFDSEQFPCKNGGRVPGEYQIRECSLEMIVDKIFEGEE